MPSRAATLPHVTAYDARAYGARDYRRTVFGGAVLGLGGAGAVAVMAGTVAVAAAWMVSGSLARNPEFRVHAPFALDSALLPSPPRRLADPADMFGSALASANPAYVPKATPAASVSAARPVAVATPQPSLNRTAELIDNVPLPAPRPSPDQTAELGGDVPLPAPRPWHAAEVRGEPQIALAPVLAAPPASIAAHVVQAEATRAQEASKPLGIAEQKQIAAIAFAPPDAGDVTGSINAVNTGPSRAVAKPALPRLAYNNPETVPGRDSRTAIYDIIAHTVYMPDGERLEAHSGLGRMMDDPHYISAKARGPTPPNTYDLTLRSGSFHGVQAIRLNPVADSRMYGRDGILAHTYMLGPSGQSFGCVSFKHYSEFLRAFQRGEVDRMIVVTHLQNPPPGVRADRGSGQRYAFDIESER
jgi:hypothetical protein